MLDHTFPEFSKDRLIQEGLKLTAYEHIRGAIKEYGLEGTEDKIREVYNNPDVKDFLLTVLYEIWKG